MGQVRHETAAATEMAGTGMVAAATGRLAAAEAGTGAREAAGAATEAAAAAAAISWDLAGTSDPEAAQAGREGQVDQADPVVQEGPVVRAVAAAKT